jgi:methyl-accepting chemotaxis protein
VAAEVRKLAERSKVAANEIVDLAKNSLKQAENTGKKMEEILPEVIKTAQLVQEITSASQEQNNGANQVNNAMQQLNGVTQQNAAASEELASNSEEMSSQAEQLQEVISFFRIDNRKQNKKEVKVKTTSSRVYKTENKKPVEKKEKKADSFDFNMDSNDSDFEKF